MKLTVLKDNIKVSEVDFSEMVDGVNEAHFFIGRAQHCHVSLDEQVFSREHAEVIYENDKWILKQLSDFRPVVVNGSIQKEFNLKNGDLIQLDRFSMNVDIEEKAEQIFENTATVALSENSPSLEKEEIELSEQEDFEEKIEINQGNNEGDELGIEISDENPDGSDEESEEGDGLNLDENESSFNIGEEDEFNVDSELDSSETEEEGSDGIEASSVDMTIDLDSDFDGEYDNTEQDGYDDEYGVEEYDDDRTQVVGSFASFSLHLFGEYAPYDVYNLVDGKNVIGRNSEKCQIVLKDPEVSGVHAQVVKVGSNIRLEDLDSGNGSLLNGKRVNESDLSSGDEFLIGSTSFTLKISSNQMSEARSTLMPVDTNQEIEVEEIVEVEEDIEGVGGDFSSSGGQSLFSVENLKKHWIKIVGGVFILLMLLPEDKKTAKPKKGAKQTTTLTKKSDDAKDRPRPKAVKQKELTSEELDYLESVYTLGRKFFEQGKYNQAIIEFEKIFNITNDYKEARQRYAFAKQGLKELEELERKRVQEEEKKRRLKKVEKLVKEAEKATKERKVKLAESLFNQIYELDPDNYDVNRLKLDLKAWEDEKKRKALEKEAKIAERKRQVNLLKPGKNLYTREKWYLAIIELEKFTKKKDIDEDLMKEGVRYLKESRSNLKKITDSLVGRARSLKEGNDLKGAFSYYKKILKHDPSFEESLNEIGKISEILEKRAKKIYREGLVYESLTLLVEAKEKFQEVLQVSPEGSEYHSKAEEKLKNYFD